MTSDAQRTAIALACGWTHVVRDPLFLRGKKPNEEYGLHVVPNYLADLNAMHEAEKFLTLKQSEMYASIIDDVLEIPAAFYGTARRAYLVMHAPAAYRAEAFLRTIGKWEFNT